MGIKIKKKADYGNDMEMLILSGVKGSTKIKTLEKRYKGDYRQGEGRHYIVRKKKKYWK